MAILLVITAGCALRLPWGPSRPIGPRVTAQEPDSTSLYTDVPYDSLKRLLDEVTRKASLPRYRRPTPPSEPGTKPEAADTLSAPDTLAVVSPDTLTTSPTVSVALPESRRRELRRTALSDLAAVNSMVAVTEQRILTEEENQKLQTIRGLIEQAQAALEREDIQAVANLAHKARLLGEELPPP
jgi:hypothetical protein